jgi:hypothetical protein
MSTVTQRIPNFLLGISQQPDNRKFPGQLKDCVNAFPDYALGLLKRPGGQFVSNLYGATTQGKWFSILRDPQEKYVAQYDDNRFRVWNLLDGSPRAVDMGADTGVPGTCNLVNLKADLTTYNAAVDDTAAKLVLLHAAQAAYAEVLAGQTSTEQALFEVQYDYDKPGEIEQTVKSGILLNANGVYIVKNDDVIISATTTLPADYALGTELTNEYPIIASQGYRVYQAILTVAATHTAGDLATAQSNMDTAQTNYDNAVAAEASALADYQAEVDLCAITATPSNGYLYGATADDLELLTLNDYTFVLNKAKVVAMDPAVTSTKPYEAFVLIKVVGTGHYRIYLDDVERGTYNAGTGGDVDAIVNDLVMDIDGQTFGTTTFSATAVGPGLYISADAPFTISAVGAPGADSVDVFQENVSTVANLPLQCRDGFKVRVVNSLDVNVDDMYVEFITDAITSISGTYSRTGTTVTVTSVAHGLTTGSEVYLDVTSGDATTTYYRVTVVDVDTFTVTDAASGTTSGDVTIVKNIYGSGVWEESNAWEITYALDPLTLPHQLIREPDGSFTFSPITWEDRVIGDLETNPDPSFIGTTINNIFFYRNRLGFLSNESVILSKAGDYFNFFATTSLTVTDDDPIDISASSIRPVNMRYVRPTSVGLVLFSDNEQFILTTDSDILSPTTTKINELSSYECDSNTEAVTLGTTLAFVSKTPLYTRLYELFKIATDSPPFMFEQTQIVPELVPSTVDSMVASAGLSIVSLGTIGSSTLYQFRYSQQGEERSITTWYKWDLTGSLLDQFFDSSTFYSVVANGTDVYVQSYDLTQSSEEGYLTLPSGEKTDVCLDLWDVNPYRTYDSGTDTTRLYLPYDSVDTKALAVVVLGSYIGEDLTLTDASVGAVLYPTVQGTAGAYYVDIDNDYRGRNLVIGYIYNMQVEMPKFFVVKSDGRTAESDFTSDLIIHRIKVATGLSGPVKYQIDITGRPEWSKTIEAVQPNIYNLNNVNLSADAVHTVPIYQRNENLSFTIIGDSPMPVSLLNLTWEGNYNTGFYRRS